MLEITAAQVTPALQGLFAGNGLVGPRSFGVLDGVRVGRILTDDPAAPRWGAVQELPWGTLFLGGALDGPPAQTAAVAAFAVGLFVAVAWWEKRRALRIQEQIDEVG